MTVKAKKMRLLALLATLCLLLAGCGELPPAALQQSTPEGQTPLSAEPEAGARARADRHAVFPLWRFRPAAAGNARIDRDAQ